jgi:mannose-1-phosphate guanylyltransferase
MDENQPQDENQPKQADGSVPKFAAVILAGGSGTRFWPRSRKASAKQVLALDGDQTMIQQTLERLLPVTAAEDVWVITNGLLDETIADQLPVVRRDRILSEPAARNTAPACALTAFLLEKTEPDTVIGIFPSDQVVKDKTRFADILRTGVKIAAAGESIVVLGITPTRAETGYGYIELGKPVEGPDGFPVHRVKRFTEKPNKHFAQQFFTSGHYRWNGGIFLWSARTLANAIREYCPDMAFHLERIAAAWGTAEFDEVLAAHYPLCENISIDYAVLEPRSARGEEASGIYCLPGDFSWNDLGSWAALHEHVVGRDFEAEQHEANVFEATDPVHVELDSKGNYVFAPGKVVALVGVENLVIVQTHDALLITTRERSQDVGKVVRKLVEAGREDLV